MARKKKFPTRPELRKMQKTRKCKCGRPSHRRLLCPSCVAEHHRDSGEHWRSFEMGRG